MICLVVEDIGPKTSSSTVHNIQFVYWFCDFVLGYMDLIEFVEVL
jgi:hypothetical protein